MENLKYIIEDRTIAELLGVQNFTTDESAILELIKNSYDAKSENVKLEFENDILTIIDDGQGLSSSDIREHWMHVGKSSKGYSVLDKKDKIRVLSGSKGIGRFALSRLGAFVTIYSKKENHKCIKWTTNWDYSSLEEQDNNVNNGTKIIIEKLRSKWDKHKIESLIDFLSKTYDDDKMLIGVIHKDINKELNNYFPNPKIGINYLSKISLNYNSEEMELETIVESDEFEESAREYYKNKDINNYNVITNIYNEIEKSDEHEISVEDLKNYLRKVGNFNATIFFNVNSTNDDKEKFLYKHLSVSNGYKSGVILYRNAFSISSFEGKKDWLGLGKRSRKSPAAASHPTGSWRVRENQLSGKVVIDKKENLNIKELSNRQGMEEDEYFNLFILIILCGIKEFERYRQEIIRAIDIKNKSESTQKNSPLTDRIFSNPSVVNKFSHIESKQLANEIKSFKDESNKFRNEIVNVETRYKYDVRILNVLATTGLRASSIAHEMQNDRNSIEFNSQNLINALKEFGMWEEIIKEENIRIAYKNVPALIKSNETINNKIVAFMDTMLQDIEKKNFEKSYIEIEDSLLRIKSNWKREFSWIDINISIKNELYFMISEDILIAIFDNLILNSIQQNNLKSNLCIDINVSQNGDSLDIAYSDNGKGLDTKYATNPRKILEVHETTRKNGHGLGMWIVNNTIVMTGGIITSIESINGFRMKFTIGGEL